MTEAEEIVALRRSVQKLSERVCLYDAHLKDALAKLDAFRAQGRVATASRDDVWFWEENGKNDPESLGCPVVMSADTLRSILGEANAFRQRRYFDANLRLIRMLGAWRMYAFTQEAYVAQAAGILDRVEWGTEEGFGTKLVHRMLRPLGTIDPKVSQALEPPSTAEAVRIITQASFQATCRAELTEAFAYKVIAAAREILDGAFKDLREYGENFVWPESMRAEREKEHV
jgi:hypothetical protein